MTRGILIIALGNYNYGNMAFNLAMSLKIIEPEMKIALVHDDTSIIWLRRFGAHVPRFFDIMIKAPKDCYTRNGKTEFIKAKSWMYELSPFDETIFLDADMIFLGRKKPSELFEQFKAIDFTAQSRGAKSLNSTIKLKNYVRWADVEDIKKAYNFTEGKYYQVASEVVFFRKTPEIKKLFHEWRHTYDNLKVAHLDFAGAIPDELPLAIAMIKTGIYPDKEEQVFIYWCQIENENYTGDTIPSKYYGFSIGGNVIPKRAKEYYDNFVKYFYRQAGLPVMQRFQPQDKRKYLPERKTA